MKQQIKDKRRLLLFAFTIFFGVAIGRHEIIAIACADESAAKVENPVFVNDKLELTVAVVFTDPTVTLSFTIKNQSPTTVYTTPIATVGNKIIIISPSGKRVVFSAIKYFPVATVVQPSSSMTWTVDNIEELIANANLDEPGLYRLVWQMEPEAEEKGFKPGEKFDSNSLYLFRNTTGALNAVVESQEVKSKFTLNLAAPLTQNPKHLVLTLITSDDKSIPSTPIFNKAIVLRIVTPGGRVVQHTIQDQGLTTALRPAESRTLESDVLEILALEKLTEAGLYRISWSVGELKSNEIPLLKK